MQPDDGLSSFLTTPEGRLKFGTWFGVYGMMFVLTVGYGFYIFFIDVVKDKYTDNREEVIGYMKQLKGAVQEQELVDQDFIKLCAVNQTRAGLEDNEIDRVTIFHSNTLDPVVGGLTAATQGAIIGIPRFMLDNKIDFENLRIKPSYNPYFKGYKLDESKLNLEERDGLFKVMTLSKDEKDFLMSRELARVNTYNAILDMVVPGLLWITAYGVGYRLNNILNLLSKPRALRFACHAPVISGLAMLYLIIKNSKDLYYENSAIEQVCKTVEQAEVAKGFYTKLIERNKQLRRLLSDVDSDYYFQEDGELTPSFYEILDYVGIKSRLKFCDELSSRLDKDLNEL